MPSPATPAAHNAALRLLPRAGLVVLALCFGILDLSAAPAIAQAPLRQRIDQALAAGFAGPYAAPASDGEFLRRVHLDLIGYGPSAEETRAFLDDPSSDKRRAVIDRLLDSPEFARHMARVFDVMLMERRPDVNVPSAQWHEYLRRSFAERKPLNQLAAEVLAGDSVDPALRPAAKFYLDRGSDVHLLTRDVGRVFLGIDMQCAQCHDHPIVSSYYQADYYGLFAFLNRSFIFTDPTKTNYLAEKADGDVTFKSVFVPDAKDEGTGPHLPGAPPMAEPQFENTAVAYLVPPADNVRPVPRYSRRAVLAREATRDTSLDFNRNLANRLWALLMGRGLVDPVDFRHDDNPPSHPELLDDLAAELAASSYDIRAILREVANSAAYQRSSEVPPDVDPATIPADRFAVAQLKPLSPEQLCWSLMRSLGIVDASRQVYAAQFDTDPRLAQISQADDRRSSLRDQFIEEGTYRALQGNCGPFVALFAGAPGPAAHNMESTVHQALFVINGPVVRSWTVPGGQNLGARLLAATDAHVVADDLYLSILARRPTREEELEIAEYLAVPPEQRTAAIQELIWALAASAEFRFNH
jgi:hypothetical protein